MVIDVLVARISGRLKSHKSGCATAEGNLASEPLVLARPMSYMNESGRPVRSLMGFYKSPLERLVVVHDELDIPFGEVRIKEGGGTAGHNGLKSLGAHLGSKEFLRVRFGIGRPRGNTPAVDHVLQRFSGSERSDLGDLLGRGADAVERLIEVGTEKAMNEFNSKGA
jgi:PTH1 family peptidyl-tRNA hydrolase